MKALESKQDVARLVVDNWRMLFEEGGEMRDRYEWSLGDAG